MNEKDYIEKEIKLSHDGRQFFARVPKRVSEFFNLKENRDYKVEFKVDVKEAIDNNLRKAEIIIKEDE